MEEDNVNSFSGYSIKFEKNTKLEKILNKIEIKNILTFKCNECFGTIRIAHIDNDEIKIYLELDCLCSRIENVPIDDLENYFKCIEIKKYNRIKIFYNSICNYHNRKFQFYCKDCQQDICSNCIEEIHVNHGLIDLIGDNITKIIIFIKDVINKNLKSKENYNIYNDNYYKIIKLLKNLILVYEEYPCYNIYYSIIAIHYFFLGIKKHKNKLNNYNDIKVICLKEKITKKKIRFPREFNNLKNEKIFQIYLTKKGFDNLYIMIKNNINFDDLKKLELQENNITNIEPLIKKNYPKLRFLNLEKNRLKDENIPFFKYLEAPNLEFLNLGDNYFSQFEILENLEHLKKLYILYLGGNKFNNDIKKEYELKPLEKIGFSFGVFSDYTINNISKFKFENLKTLFLNGDNLHSLSFLENLNYPKLEELFLRLNDIENIEDLIKYKDNFKNLRKLNLKSNRIRDISKLEDLINSFPNLNILIISDNRIEINNKNNNKIIKNIYKKRNIKLDIY